jgi:hypothetical protein
MYAGTPISDTRTGVTAKDPESRGRQENNTKTRD